MLYTEVHALGGCMPWVCVHCGYMCTGKCVLELRDLAAGTKGVTHQAWLSTLGLLR